MYNNEVLNFKDKAKTLNNLTYTDYFYRLMLLSRSVFEWSGLPNGIDEKWIEKYLFHTGKCIFFKHPKLGFMVSKCTHSDELNPYNEPTQLTPDYINTLGDSFEPLFNYSSGFRAPAKKGLKEFFHGVSKTDVCVLIRNNDICFPTAPTVDLFALRLTEIQRAIDININAQKTPILIKCTEKQKQSLKQLFVQWNGFEPVIFGDKNLDTDKVEALNMEAPIVFDKLQIQKHSVWNEVMTFLGINNANMDKRERLVDDEVQANNEQIMLSAYVMLKSRELACKQINECFGLNVSVRLRSPEELNFEVLEGVTNE